MFKESKFWNKKKILITGHTGFKGSWLSLMLYNFGAKLYGYSLKPKKNDLFLKAKLISAFPEKYEIINIDIGIIKIK